MSDLVENVRAAVRPHLYSEGGNSEVVARAAIAAVLEHLADNVSDEMVEAAMGRADPNANYRTAEVAIILKRAISAALRAAAEGEK